MSIASDSEHVDVSVRRLHPLVGFCIYCGEDEGTLTDEHPVPDGFGGRQILPKSSCTVCQKIINEEVEQYCLQRYLGLGRAAFDIRGAKKRLRPPPTIRVQRPGRPIERIVIEGDVPALIHLPVWPKPYFLQGLPTPDRWDGKMWAWQSEGTLEQFGAEKVLTEEINNAKFARFLAKMAHAQAFAEFGPDFFIPWLPPIILGQDKGYISLVGGSLDVRPPVGDEILSLGFSQYKRPNDGHTLLTANIRLFNFLGSPDYIIVVGEALKPWPDDYEEL